jgi:predicted membrane channel-forming protein YqfA (hemolysin III family)
MTLRSLVEKMHANGEVVLYLISIKTIFSLFQLTNETVNIWTHLLGCLIFFALLIYSNAVTIPSVHGGYADHVVFTCFLLFYQVCDWSVTIMTSSRHLAWY